VTGSTKLNKPYLIGVSGGSGSGKTYFASALQAQLGASVCEIVSQDNFYIDQSHRFDRDGGSVNFDHPSSIDFDLLAESLQLLRSGQPAPIPVYEFVTHKRLSAPVVVKPKPVILVDGILIFHAAKVRELFDDLIFFDTSEQLRFKRRQERDVRDRGRTLAGVHQQFFAQVKPMHDLFVEPSKAYAKRIVVEGVDYEKTLAHYCTRLRAL
jgi:uridine kinase